MNFMKISIQYDLVRLRRARTFWMLSSTTTLRLTASGPVRVPWPALPAISSSHQRYRYRYKWSFAVKQICQKCSGTVVRLTVPGPAGPWFEYRGLSHIKQKIPGWRNGASKNTLGSKKMLISSEPEPHRSIRLQLWLTALAPLNDLNIDNLFSV